MELTSAAAADRPRAAAAPAIAVVVPTRGRPLRLRWLLNALEEQALERFEVVVAHPGDDAETAALLRSHPLRPRALPVTGASSPAALRNAAWRAACAPLVAFTDDDCRPPAEWLARALAAARAEPGAIVQGATRPDPDELAVYQHAPYARSQEIDPPHPMVQTCNVVYPRALLEALGGFDEAFPQAVGEDADLALRAQAAGARVVGAPDVLTYHAVDYGLVRRLRSTWRWQHMALLVRRHPEVRRQLPLRGAALDARHAWLLAAVAGALLARRAPALAAALALPYLARTPLPYGRHPRALARTASELPGRALLDAAATAALLRGSVRYRTPLL